MTGTYGTVKPSLINPQMDVEIWYHYRPTRNSEDESFKNFKKLIMLVKCLAIPLVIQH